MGRTELVPEKAPEAGPTEMPEKYQGLSIEQLVERHENALTRLGQQGNEIGELRKMVNQLTPQQREEPAVDFWDDPDSAIERKIQKAMEPLLVSQRESKIEATKAKLSADFPGWEETIEDLRFKEWVSKEDGRLAQYREADENIDLAAARALLKGWTESQQTEEATNEAAEEAIKRDRNRRASVTEKGSARHSRGQSFSRTEIRRLMAEDPERYQAMRPAIAEAYKAGRVRE